MSITFHIDAFDVSLKNDVAFALLQLNDLPEVSKQAIIEYGLQRIINDAANSGGKDATDEDRLAKAKIKWEALVAGTIRAGGGRTSNPVQQRANALGAAMADRDLPAGQKLSDWRGSKDFKAKAGEYAKHEKVQAMAARQVAEAKELAELTL